MVFQGKYTIEKSDILLFNESYSGMKSELTQMNVL